MPDLESLKRQRRDIVQAGLELDAAMAGNGSFDQRSEMRRLTLRLTGIDQEIEEAMMGDGHMRASIYGGEGAGHPDDSLTPGEAFVRSEAYQSWVRQYPSGAPSYGDSKSGTVSIGRMGNFLGLVDPTIKARTLVTAADTSAGDLVSPLHRGLVEPGLIRPLTLRSLLTIIPVTTDSVEYVREVSRVQAAAPVAEATALTGTSGLKPEGGLVFDVVQTPVRTIAVWVPATKRILSDAPALQAYINEFISFDLGRELEDQVLAGTGSGEDFVGILNTPGVLTQGVPADHNNFDAIRLAKAQIVLLGRTIPNAIILHPNDSAQMDVSKSGAAASPYGYWGSGPLGPGNGPGRLWGMNVVESDAITENAALVGDFSRALLYDRESTTLSVGTVNDDFVRNIVRVLGELRAGFGVVRPSAFCRVTLAA